MTTPDQARAIAAGLSEAQRDTLLSAEIDGQLGKYFIRWWHGKHTTLQAIRRKNLAFTVWSGLCLNNLGLAVRAILQEQSNG